MIRRMTALADPRPVFERYEILARDADAAFARVKSEFSGCVTCHEGCSDCCHALFDLTLVEAAYLNDAFLRAFPPGAARSAVLERAYAADRQAHAFKREAFKASQAGRDVDAVLEDMAKRRVRCPLLGDGERCVLYEQRPVTCRVYGVPTAIAGKGHVCGKSAFERGRPYPTANLDRMHEKLLALSRDFASHMQSGFSAIHTVLVPVSMALITAYDAAYYGSGRKGARKDG